MDPIGDAGPCHIRVIALDHRSRLVQAAVHEREAHRRDLIGQCLSSQAEDAGTRFEGFLQHACGGLGTCHHIIDRGSHADAIQLICNDLGRTRGIVGDKADAHCMGTQPVDGL